MIQGHFVYKNGTSVRVLDSERREMGGFLSLKSYYKLLSRIGPALATFVIDSVNKNNDSMKDLC